MASENKVEVVLLPPSDEELKLNEDIKKYQPMLDQLIWFLAEDGEKTSTVVDNYFATYMHRFETFKFLLKEMKEENILYLYAKLIDIKINNSFDRTLLTPQRCENIFNKMYKTLRLFAMPHDIKDAIDKMVKLDLKNLEKENIMPDNS